MNPNKNNDGIHNYNLFGMVDRQSHWFTAYESPRGEHPRTMALLMLDLESVWTFESGAKNVWFDQYEPTMVERTEIEIYNLQNMVRQGVPKSSKSIIPDAKIENKNP